LGSVSPQTPEGCGKLKTISQYLAVFAWMLFAYLTHRIKWRSRYSLLFFHVTIRLASQASGIGFGVLGFANTNLFLGELLSVFVNLRTR
jgi:hypothetical protein